MGEQSVVHMRRWTFALGSSVAAMAAASATPASAQCVSDPTVTYGTIDCTGMDTDGLAVPKSGTSVTVASGATVGAGTSDQPGAITLTGANQVLTVNGLVDGNLGGNKKAGVAFYAGPPSTVPCDPYSGASIGYCPPTVVANLIVGAGATVTGAQAVLIGQHPQNQVGDLYIGVTNSGTLTGTQGPAIVNQATGGSLSITNEATGRIDGIAGRVNYVRNEGTIDGGTGSAIVVTAAGFSNAQIINRGSIVSAGDSPTLNGTGSIRLYVSNDVGAVIGGGLTAISTDAGLILGNGGTIRGSIVSTAGADQSSLIDTRLGTIEGDVLLGAGNDTVYALFDAATTRVSSITGQLDGGAGVDTLDLQIGADVTLAGNVLPASFERLGINLADEATVSLAPTFTVPAGITLGGLGSLINQADLATTGPAIVGASYSVSVTNQANVAAALSGNGEAAVSGINLLNNTGTITARGGDGVRIGQLDNSGTITASGTAAYVDNGGVTNTGTIVSTGGIGVLLGAYNASSTNTGSIRGANYGVTLNGTLTNGGTIAGDTSGVLMEGFSARLLNQSGGIIAGGISTTGYGAIVSNAGTIAGSVALGEYGSNVFVDAGGTVDGAIVLGDSNDLLVVDYSADPNRPFAGAIGGVDAGGGYNTLRYRVNVDADTDIAWAGGFEGLAYEVTTGAALTLRSGDVLANTLGLTGDGTITLEGTLSGTDFTLIDADLRTTEELLSGSSGTPKLTIVNNGALSLTVVSYNPYASGIRASGADVVNNGSITLNLTDNWPWSAEAPSAIYHAGTVTNTGTIAVSGGARAIGSTHAVVNSGTISGTGQTYGYYNLAGISSFGTLDNSGTIRFEGDAVAANYYGSTISNSGTLESVNGTAVRMGSGTVLTNEAGGAIRSDLAIDISEGGTIINRGIIAGDVGSRYGNYGPATFVADGGTVEGNVVFGWSDDIFLQTGQDSGVTGIVDGGVGRNAWGQAFRESASIALAPAGTQFVNFQDAAVMALGKDTVVRITDAQAMPSDSNLLLGGDGKVVNTATINGQITTRYGLAQALGETNEGLDAFENRGTLTGGFAGTVADFANSGTISASVWLEGAQMTVGNSGSITNEGGATALNLSLSQLMTKGSAASASLVNGGTISGSGIGVAVQPVYWGPAVRAPMPVDVSASLAITNTATGVISGVESGLTVVNAALNLDNAGTIAGGGDDPKAVIVQGSAGATVRNTGTISGGISLGDGADRVENRGSITGTILLGDGNDSFTEYAGSTVTGGVDGGAGVDLYRVVLSGDRTGIGARTNFELLAVEGSGTLTLALDQDFQSVALAGANLAASLGNFAIGRIDGSAATESVTLDRDVGTVALGAGDDRLTLNAAQQAGTTFNGAYDGGEGYDILTVGTPGQGAYTLGSTITGFERLEALSSLNLASNSFAFDRVALTRDLTIASGASLAASRVDLGGADTHLAIAGDFTGSVMGSTGRHAIDVSGNAVFTAIAEVDALRMSAGLAAVSGQASLGAISLSGGRFVGLAGSTISAPTIEVARGAVFGSAGIVNGNVAVAGTLSPGSSPGTMTVNGNVALAGTSVSVFEITPTIADKLVIDGTLVIAQGATLQIVADQAVRPGQSLDLITTTGGITGSFTNIVKPASLFGFVVQREGTISLLGQFLNDARYSGQVRSAIDYANAVLASGTASSAFATAVPALLTASGAADQAAFAQLTPEAYASAGQIAVEQGLELAATGRSAAFAPAADLTGGTPSAFTFASALGATRTLKGGLNGTAQARINGYGFLGGLGFGGGDGAAQWSLGAFVGYLDGRQVLAGRGARTDVDGVVAGVHGRWTGASGLGVKATFAYSGGSAITRRGLPGGIARTATAEYDLAGWTGDISVDYAVPMGRNWTVRPGVGVTAIRTMREGATETGGGAFALDVAKRRDDAVFVDGALTLRGGMAEGTTVRPFLSLGARYQLEGRTPYALAALGGGDFGLQAAGASRARLLATATVGADVALTTRLTLFGALSGESGEADNRASANAGLRLNF